MIALSTPKQKGMKSLYYAGFNPAFVRDVLTCSKFSPDNVVILDPWNGSGTTTAVAHELGFTSMGLDLNPVTLILASVRLATSKHIEQALTLLPTLQKHSNTPNPHFYFPWVDAPTQRWLKTLSANLKAIDCPLIHSVLFVAVTQCLHQQLQPFKTSNPTWIKRIKTPNEQLSINKKAFLTSVRDYILTQITPFTHHTTAPMPTLLHGDAQQLTRFIQPESVDLIITSPPYCTRLDYVIATLPELYFLGLNDIEIQGLRKRMIGTPCVSYQEETLPEHLEAVLTKIKAHSSKASSTYYYKTYRQYFTQIQQAFLEIKQVLKPNGYLHMVVQDSYYKEIPIPLAELFLNSLTNFGFSIEAQDPFEAGGFNYLKGNKHVKEISFLCQKL